MSCFPLFLALYSIKSSCAIKTIKSVNKSDVTKVAVISQHFDRFKKIMITLIYRNKHSPESCLYRKKFLNSLEKLTTASDFCRVTDFQLLHVRCGCFLGNFLQIFRPAITQNTYEGVLLNKATKIHSYDTTALMYGYITFWMSYVLT